MRRILTLAFILGVFISFNSALAQSGDGPLWVSGEVASIFEDQDGAIFSLKLASGENYNISVTNELLEDIKVGDYVTVEISKGWAELIEKGDAKTGATPKPEKKKTGPQWVAGELVAINEGQEDSLLSIKLSNDKIFNVSASNDKISGIDIGDYITVKILKGWAQSITKK
ncbi:MAG: hypothetical protein DHS20C13_22750 [Thermodesulfobacteriota bacterium]|nr:MAG: hypothetical protein DHS20C13_22750 [Thermodesulfobacteriota bacterium]